MRRWIWPALAGYAGGLATAGAIAMLLPAGSLESGSTSPESGVPSSTPTAPSPAAPATAPTATASAAAIPQHSAAPLSAEARGRIAPLEARLAADPSDLRARKQLAVLLLQNQQLMLAYEHASQILAASPDDADGLYVHGVVRLAMGHAPRALELLDRVLERYPDHAMALEARAEAQRKIGDAAGAALTAARARKAARGDGSEIEQLLAAASDGSLLEMMRSAPSKPAAGEEDGGG